MPCTSCKSVNQRKFATEMGIHFIGLENLDRPTVWILPLLSVCLDCGLAEFVIPDAQLSELKTLDSGHGMGMGVAG